jgi:hypothetical protein
MNGWQKITAGSKKQKASPATFRYRHESLRRRTGARNFDALDALVQWSSREKLRTVCLPLAQFPGVSRSLWAWPKHAEYNGTGPRDAATSDVVKRALYRLTGMRVLLSLRRGQRYNGWRWIWFRSGHRICVVLSSDTRSTGPSLQRFAGPLKSTNPIAVLLSTKE